MDDLSAEPQTYRFRLEHEHVLLAVHLEGDLRLPKSLPTSKHRVRWICTQQRLVAGQRGMRALRGNLAWKRYQYAVLLVSPALPTARTTCKWGRRVVAWCEDRSVVCAGEEIAVE